MRPVFTVVRWREGYQIDEVDAFLDDIEPRVARGAASGLVDEILHVTFGPVRIKRGYDMDEVDHYLDALAVQARGT